MHLCNLIASFVARPLATYPVYTARIFSRDVQLLEQTSETLPRLCIWCRQHVIFFDSDDRVRREFNRFNIYTRGYQFIATDSPCFVLITLAF
jgi:hypothetical protein